MSRVTISEAAKQFKVSRNTVYKRISDGELTKDTDGLLDTSDLVRVFYVNSKDQSDRTGLSSKNEQLSQHPEHDEQQLEQLQQENIQLRQLLAVNEMLVNQLQQQIQDLKQDKEYLYQELNQKRIESREVQENRRGLLSRLFR